MDVSIGNVIGLALTSLVTGGFLNQWILKRKFNGESLKFLLVSCIALFMICGYLYFTQEYLHKIVLFIGLNSLAPMSLGIFMDEKYISTWIYGKNKR